MPSSFSVALVLSSLSFIHLGPATLHTFVLMVCIQRLRTEEVSQLTLHNIGLTLHFFVLGHGTYILVPMCHLLVSQITASKVPLACHVVAGEKEGEGHSQPKHTVTRESSLGCELVNSHYLSVVEMRNLRH